MWLYFPYLSAQASGDSTSGLTSDSAALELCRQSVTWNGKSPQPKSLLAAWKKGRFLPLQFGAISQPLMDGACADWWTWLRRDSRARTTAWPESGGEGSGSTGRFGITSCAPFGRWDRDSSCWRTSQESVFRTEPERKGWFFRQDSTLFLGTWPRAGTMRNGCVYERPTLELRTEESGGSAWHGWPTPRRITGVAESAEQKKEHGCLWQTPTADPFRSRGGTRVQEVGLDRQAREFPVPVSRDQAPSRLRLANAPSGSGCSGNGRILRRRLNPAFVSWLMGLPWWWTNPGGLSFACLETRLYLSRLRWLCESCLEGWGLGQGGVKHGANKD